MICSMACVERTARYLRSRWASFRIACEVGVHRPRSAVNCAADVQLLGVADEHHLVPRLQLACRKSLSRSEDRQRSAGAMLTSSTKTTSRSRWATGDAPAAAAGFRAAGARAPRTAPSPLSA